MSMVLLRERSCKAISVFLATLLFISNSILVHAAESNFWKERSQAKIEQTKESPIQLASLPLPQLEQIQSPVFNQSIKTLVKEKLGKDQSQYAQLNSILSVIPAQLGTIRKISTPLGRSRNKIVVHVQDIHMNSEAQNNIATMVKVLSQKQKADVVALEGAFAPLDFKPYREFKYPEAVRMMSDYLLAQNKISGPIHTAFNLSSTAPQFIGVDDRTHHQANIAAYLSSSKETAAQKKVISKAIEKLNKEKEKKLNHDLLAFDHESAEQTRDALSLGDYLAKASQHKVEGFYPQVETFLEAYRMEKALDFKVVEAERAQLVEKLVQTIDRQEMNDLMNHSVQFRTGFIRHNDFYSYLKDLTQRNHISLARYKAMDKYVQYILLSDSIDGEKLYSEVNDLREKIYATLIQLPSEKSLIQASRFLLLAEKLVDFSLTQDEWEEYQGLVRRSDRPTVRNDFSDRSTVALSDSLASFEKFYEEAEVRDTAMASNLLRAMNADDHRVAVLVTGGFHSKGIDAKLRQAGFLTVNFTPQLTKVDSASGSSYLSVFSQQKTPLEQMFEGEKLFLSQNLQEGMSSAPPITIANAVRLGAPVEDVPQMHRSLASRATAVIQSAKKIKDGVVLLINRANEKIELTVRYITRGNKDEVSQVSEKSIFSSWWVRLGLPSLMVAALGAAESIPHAVPAVAAAVSSPVSTVMVASIFGVSLNLLMTGFLAYMVFVWFAGGFQKSNEKVGKAIHDSLTYLQQPAIKKKIGQAVVIMLFFVLIHNIAPLVVAPLSKILTISFIKASPILLGLAALTVELVIIMENLPLLGAMAFVGVLIFSIPVVNRPATNFASTIHKWESDRKAAAADAKKKQLFARFKDGIKGMPQWVFLHLIVDVVKVFYSFGFLPFQRFTQIWQGKKDGALAENRLSYLEKRFSRLHPWVQVFAIPFFGAATIISRRVFLLLLSQLAHGIFSLFLPEAFNVPWLYYALPYGGHNAIIHAIYQLSSPTGFLSTFTLAFLLLMVARGKDAYKYEYEVKNKYGSVIARRSRFGRLLHGSIQGLLVPFRRRIPSYDLDGNKGPDYNPFRQAFSNAFKFPSGLFWVNVEITTFLGVLNFISGLSGIKFIMDIGHRVEDPKENSVMGIGERLSNAFLTGKVHNPFAEQPIDYTGGGDQAQPVAQPAQPTEPVRAPEPPAPQQIPIVVDQIERPELKPVEAANVDREGLAQRLRNGLDAFLQRAGWKTVKEGDIEYASPDGQIKLAKEWEAGARHIEMSNRLNEENGTLMEATRQDFDHEWQPEYQFKDPKEVEKILDSDDIKFFAFPDEGIAPMGRGKELSLEEVEQYLADKKPFQTWWFKPNAGGPPQELRVETGTNWLKVQRGKTLAAQVDFAEHASALALASDGQKIHVENPKNPKKPLERIRFGYVVSKNDFGLAKGGSTRFFSQEDIERITETKDKKGRQKTEKVKEGGDSWPTLALPEFVGKDGKGVGPKWGFYKFVNGKLVRYNPLDPNDPNRQADLIVLEHVRDGKLLDSSDPAYNDPLLWDEIRFGRNAENVKLGGILMDWLGHQIAMKDARRAKRTVLVRMGVEATATAANLFAAPYVARSIHFAFNLWVIGTDRVRHDIKRDDLREFVTKQLTAQRRFLDPNTIIEPTAEEINAVMISIETDREYRHRLSYLSEVKWTDRTKNAMNGVQSGLDLLGEAIPPVITHTFERAFTPTGPEDGEVTPGNLTESFTTTEKGRIPAVNGYGLNGELELFTFADVFGVTGNVLNVLSQITGSEWFHRITGRAHEFPAGTPPIYKDGQWDFSLIQPYIAGFPTKIFVDYKTIDNFIKTENAFATEIERPKWFYDLVGLKAVKFHKKGETDVDNMNLFPVGHVKVFRKGMANISRLPAFVNMETGNLVVFREEGFETLAKRHFENMQRFEKYMEFQMRRGAMISRTQDAGANLSVTKQPTANPHTNPREMSNYLLAMRTQRGLIPSFAFDEKGDDGIRQIVHSYDSADNAMVLAETGNEQEGDEILDYYVENQKTHKKVDPTKKKSPFLLANAVDGGSKIGLTVDGSGAHVGPSAEMVVAWLRSTLRSSLEKFGNTWDTAQRSTRAMKDKFESTGSLQDFFGMGRGNGKDRDAFKKAIKEFNKGMRDSKFLATAKTVGDAMLKLQNESGFHEGGIPHGVDQADKEIFSTEENARAFAALKMLYEMTGEEKYAVGAMKIVNWLATRAFNHEKGYFIQGYSGLHANETMATDANAVTVRALKEILLFARNARGDPLFNGMETISNVLENVEDARVTVKTPYNENTVLYDFIGRADAEKIPGRKPVGFLDGTGDVAAAHKTYSEILLRLSDKGNSEKHAKKARSIRAEMDKNTVKTKFGDGIPYATAPDVQAYADRPEYKTPKAGTATAGTARRVFAELVDPYDFSSRMPDTILEDQVGVEPPFRYEAPDYVVGDDGYQGVKNFLRSFKNGLSTNLDINGKTTDAQGQPVIPGRYKMLTPLNKDGIAILADSETGQRVMIVLKATDEQIERDLKKNEEETLQVEKMNEYLSKGGVLAVDEKGQVVILEAGEAGKKALEEQFKYIDSLPYRTRNAIKDEKWVYHRLIDGKKVKFILQFPPDGFTRTSIDPITKEEVTRTFTKVGQTYSEVIRTKHEITEVAYNNRGVETHSETYAVNDKGEKGDLLRKAETVKVYDDGNYTNRLLIKKITRMDGVRGAVEFNVFGEFSQPLIIRKGDQIIRNEFDEETGRVKETRVENATEADDEVLNLKVCERATYSDMDADHVIEKTVTTYADETETQVLNTRVERWKDGELLSTITGTGNDSVIAVNVKENGVIVGGKQMVLNPESGNIDFVASETRVINRDANWYGVPVTEVQVTDTDPRSGAKKTYLRYVDENGRTVGEKHGDWKVITEYSGGSSLRTRTRWLFGDDPLPRITYRYTDAFTAEVTNSWDQTARREHYIPGDAFGRIQSIDIVGGVKQYRVENSNFVPGTNRPQETRLIDVQTNKVLELQTPMPQMDPQGRNMVRVSRYSNTDPQLVAEEKTVIIDPNDPLGRPAAELRENGNIRTEYTYETGKVPPAIVKSTIRMTVNGVDTLLPLEESIEETRDLKDIFADDIMVETMSKYSRSRRTQYGYSKEGRQYIKESTIDFYSGRDLVARLNEDRGTISFARQLGSHSNTAEQPQRSLAGWDEYRWSKAQRSVGDLFAYSIRQNISDVLNDTFRLSDIPDDAVRIYQRKNGNGNFQWKETKLLNGAGHHIGTIKPDDLYETADRQVIQRLSYDNKDDETLENVKESIAYQYDANSKQVGVEVLSQSVVDNVADLVDFNTNPAVRAALGEQVNGNILLRSDIKVYKMKDERSKSEWFAVFDPRHGEHPIARINGVPGARSIEIIYYKGDAAYINDRRFSSVDADIAVYSETFEIVGKNIGRKIFRSTLNIAAKALVNRLTPKIIGAPSEDGQGGLGFVSLQSKLADSIAYDIERLNPLNAEKVLDKSTEVFFRFQKILKINETTHRIGLTVHDKAEPWNERASIDYYWDGNNIGEELGFALQIPDDDPDYPADDQTKGLKRVMVVDVGMSLPFIEYRDKIDGVQMFRDEGTYDILQPDENDVMLRTHDREGKAANLRIRSARESIQSQEFGIALSDLKANFSPYARIKYTYEAYHQDAKNGQPAQDYSATLLRGLSVARLSEAFLYTIDPNNGQQILMTKASSTSKITDVTMSEDKGFRVSTHRHGEGEMFNKTLYTDRVEIVDNRGIKVETHYGNKIKANGEVDVEMKFYNLVNDSDPLARYKIAANTLCTLVINGQEYLFVKAASTEKLLGGRVKYKTQRGVSDTPIVFAPNADAFDRYDQLNRDHSKLQLKSVSSAFVEVKDNRGYLLVVLDGYAPEDIDPVTRFPKDGATPAWINFPQIAISRTDSGAPIALAGSQVQLFHEGIPYENITKAYIPLAQMHREKMKHPRLGSPITDTDDLTELDYARFPVVAKTGNLTIENDKTIGSFLRYEVLFDRRVGGTLVARTFRTDGRPFYDDFSGDEDQPDIIRSVYTIFSVPGYDLGLTLTGGIVPANSVVDATKFIIKKDEKTGAYNFYQTHLEFWREFQQAAITEAGHRYLVFKEVDQLQGRVSKVIKKEPGWVVFKDGQFLAKVRYWSISDSPIDRTWTTWEQFKSLFFRLFGDLFASGAYVEAKNIVDTAQKGNLFITQDIPPEFQTVKKKAEDRAYRNERIFWVYGTPAFTIASILGIFLLIWYLLGRPSLLQQAAIRAINRSNALIDGRFNNRAILYVQRKLNDWFQPTNINTAPVNELINAGLRRDDADKIVMARREQKVFPNITTNEQMVQLLISLGIDQKYARRVARKLSSTGRNNITQAQIDEMRQALSGADINEWLQNDVIAPIVPTIQSFINQNRNGRSILTAAQAQAAMRRFSARVYQGSHSVEELREYLLGEIYREAYWLPNGLSKSDAMDSIREEVEVIFERLGLSLSDFENRTLVRNIMTLVRNKVPMERVSFEDAQNLQNRHSNPTVTNNIWIVDNQVGFASIKLRDFVIMHYAIPRIASVQSVGAPLGESSLMSTNTSMLRYYSRQVVDRINRGDEASEIQQYLQRHSRFWYRVLEDQFEKFERMRDPRTVGLQYADRNRRVKRFLLIPEELAELFRYLNRESDLDASGVLPATIANADPNSEFNQNASAVEALLERVSNGDYAHFDAISNTGNGQVNINNSSLRQQRENVSNEIQTQIVHDTFERFILGVRRHYRFPDMRRERGETGVLRFIISQFFLRSAFWRLDPSVKTGTRELRASFYWGSVALLSLLTAGYIVYWVLGHLRVMPIPLDIPFLANLPEQSRWFFYIMACIPLFDIFMLNMMALNNTLKGVVHIINVIRSVVSKTAAPFAGFAPDVTTGQRDISKGAKYWWADTFERAVTLIPDMMMRDPTMIGELETIVTRWNDERWVNSNRENPTDRAREAELLIEQLQMIQNVPENARTEAHFESLQHALRNLQLPETKSFLKEWVNMFYRKDKPERPRHFSDLRSVSLQVSAISESMLIPLSVFNTYFPHPNGQNIGSVLSHETISFTSIENDIARYIINNTGTVPRQAQEFVVDRNNQQIAESNYSFMAILHARRNGVDLFDQTQRAALAEMAVLVDPFHVHDLTRIPRVRAALQNLTQDQRDIIQSWMTSQAVTPLRDYVMRYAIRRPGNNPTDPATYRSKEITDYEREVRNGNLSFSGILFAQQNGHFIFSQDQRTALMGLLTTGVNAHNVAITRAFTTMTAEQRLVMYDWMLSQFDVKQTRLGMMASSYPEQFNLLIDRIEHLLDPAQREEIRGMTNPDNAGHELVEFSRDDARTREAVENITEWCNLRTQSLYANLRTAMYARDAYRADIIRIDPRLARPENKKELDAILNDKIQITFPMQTSGHAMRAELRTLPQYRSREISPGVSTPARSLQYILGDLRERHAQGQDYLAGIGPRWREHLRFIIENNIDMTLGAEEGAADVHRLPAKYMGWIGAFAHLRGEVVHALDFDHRNPIHTMMSFSRLTREFSSDERLGIGTYKMRIFTTPLSSLAKAIGGPEEGHTGAKNFDSDEIFGANGFYGKGTGRTDAIRNFEGLPDQYTAEDIESALRLLTFGYFTRHFNWFAIDKGLANQLIEALKPLMKWSGDAPESIMGVIPIKFMWSPYVHFTKKLDVLFSFGFYLKKGAVVRVMPMMMFVFFFLNLNPWYGLSLTLWIYAFASAQSIGVGLWSLNVQDYGLWRGTGRYLKLMLFIFPFAFVVIPIYSFAVKMGFQGLTRFILTGGKGGPQGTVRNDDTYIFLQYSITVGMGIVLIALFSFADPLKIALWSPYILGGLSMWIGPFMFKPFFPFKKFLKDVAILGLSSVTVWFVSNFFVLSPALSWWLAAVPILLTARFVWQFKKFLFDAFLYAPIMVALDVLNKLPSILWFPIRAVFLILRDFRYIEDTTWIHQVAQYRVPSFTRMIGFDEAIYARASQLVATYATSSNPTLAALTLELRAWVGTQNAQGIFNDLGSMMANPYEYDPTLRDANGDPLPRVGTAPSDRNPSIVLLMRVYGYIRLISQLAPQTVYVDETEPINVAGTPEEQNLVREYNRRAQNRRWANNPFGSWWNGVKNLKGTTHNPFVDTQYASWLKNPIYIKYFSWWFETLTTLAVTILAIQHYQLQGPLVFSALMAGVFWAPHAIRSFMGEGLKPLVQGKTLAFTAAHFLLPFAFGHPVSTVIGIVGVIVAHWFANKSGKEEPATTMVSREQAEMEIIVALLQGKATSLGISSPHIVINPNERNVSVRIAELARKFTLPGTDRVVSPDQITSTMQELLDIIVEKYLAGLNRQSLEGVSLQKIQWILQEAFISGGKTQTLHEIQGQSGRGSLIIVNEALLKNTDLLRNMIAARTKQNKGRVILLGESAEVTRQLETMFASDIAASRISIEYQEQLIARDVDTSHVSVVLKEVDALLKQKYSNVQNIEIITPSGVTLNSHDLDPNSILAAAVFIILNENLRFIQLNMQDIDRIDRLARLIHSQA